MLEQAVPEQPVARVQTAVGEVLFTGADGDLITVRGFDLMIYRVAYNLTTWVKRVAGEWQFDDPGDGFWLTRSTRVPRAAPPTRQAIHLAREAVLAALRRFAPDNVLFLLDAEATALGGRIVAKQRELASARAVVSAAELAIGRLEEEWRTIDERRSAQYPATCGAGGTERG